jgi:hypothetical protein
MSKRTRIIVAAVVAVVAVAVVFVVATAKPDVTPGPQSAAAATATPTPTESAAPKLTSAQQQAVRAADGYQTFMYYSRQGLVDQLVTFDHFNRQGRQVSPSQPRHRGLGRAGRPEGPAVPQLGNALQQVSV